MRAPDVSRDSQLVLVLDDDLMITEALAAGLEREGRTVITCNDLESAQLIVERLRPSHIVSDVRLSGPFSFEGLDFIRYAKRFAPESRIILMTGDGPEALQLEASERGAVAFLRKPFEISEVDAILNLISPSVLSSKSTESPTIRMPMLDEIIHSKSLRPLFQPIVDLNQGNRFFAYEALTRFRDNDLLRDPEVLFLYASRKQRICDMELACSSATLQVARDLSRAGLLFMNIHPDVFTQGSELIDLLVRDSERYGIDLGRLVLEITEQASLTDSPGVFQQIEALRALGIRFAFDDVGIAYSHLPHIGKIRPSFLKISQHFGTSFETDPTKRKIVANLLSLARDFDSELILEGIEHASTAEAAREMGIPYGQGFLFARPTEASILTGG